MFFVSLSRSSSSGSAPKKRKVLTVDDTQEYYSVNAKVETLVVVEVATEGGLPAKFPSDFKWQKLALSAPLKPRKVAMHPRFTTPERLTPSYALVGGRGGEKILRY